MMTNNWMDNVLLRRVVLFSGMAAMGAALGFGTNTWNNTVAPGGNTPATAYNWNDPNNWTDTSYVPATFGDGADLGSATTAPRFIRLPALGTFGLTYAKWANNNHLLGDFVFGDDPTAKFGARQGVNTGSIIYGDFYPNSLSLVAYVGAFAIAGHYRPATANPMGRSTSIDHWGRTGDLTMRMDLFAESPDPVRTPPFQDKGSTLSNGDFCFIGPRGAPAQSGTWSQTAGSTYLNKVSMSGTVVPGSLVTGEGIPSGTFVKYVFSTTGWIELSEAVTLTIAENPLTFGAITPSVEQTIRTEAANSINGVYIRALKYREEDGCRLIYPSIGSSGTNAKKRNWGLKTDEVNAGYIPGDIVISNMTLSGGSTASNCLFNAVRLELPNILTPDWHLLKGCTARLTVPEGRTGGFANFYGGQGVVEKRGSGTLSLGFVTSGMPGTIKVDEGVIAVSETASLAAGSILLGRLELAADTTLKLPANGMSVSNLVAGTGSVIEGPGTLTVITTVEGIPSVTGGARVTLVVPAPDASSVFPAPARWLHLDASAANTITTNSAGGITRWDDADGTGEYASAPRRTGTANRPAGCPTLRVNAVNSLPMVDLGEISFTNAGYGVSSVPDRSLIFKKSSGTSYSAATGTDVAANPNPYIKTAFFVVGSEYGGGPLLGINGNNYPMYGMQHAPSTDFSTAIISTLPNLNWGQEIFANSSIDAGTTLFRTNGVSIYPRSTPFSGGFDVISFSHATGRKSSGLGFYGEESATYPVVANGLLYGEVVLFTNQLSFAQVEAAEAYLMRKWFGRNMPYYYRAKGEAFAVAAGSSLSVTGGGELETSAIGGGGTVEGSVVLDEDAVVAVTVEGTTVPMLTVTGDVSLPASATVVVSGSLSSLDPGDYPILSAGTFTGSVSGWNVEHEGRSRVCRVSVADGSMVLSVYSSGTMMIFR